ISILNDKILISEVEKQLKTERKNVEFIFNRTIKKYLDALTSISDNYFRERAADIKDISDRVVLNLQKKKDHKQTLSDEFTGQRIIIADELAPTDIAEFEKEKILAVVTESGGKTSHTAIMARSIGIPAVVGVPAGLTDRARNGDITVVDGYVGTVVLNASKTTLQLYAEKETKDQKLHTEFLNEIRLRPETIDGFRIQIAANIEYPEESELAMKYGAAGIGLMRSEYLIFKKDPPLIPSEEEQFESYSKIASDMRGYPVTIRTFDIGGDKMCDYFNYTEEPNPFLGWRAIRIFLEHKEILKTQLRAILRASSFGNLKIMFPMITFSEEIDALLEILEETKKELRNQSVPFDENIKVGIMIETPSAALIADKLAPKVDFFSIGTNDLTQYTLAVDRTNAKIDELFQPAHPSILNLIDNTIRAAKRTGIWVSVCGEMSGDPLFASILIGLGVNELSMTPSLIPSIRRLIRKLKMLDLEELARQALLNTTSEENLSLAAELINKSAPEILSMGSL
ncbi:MAG TPA: phosphoenolpyruvate--protein phosphotransferase, partial [Victivallales bacterium]|nr:phosphoenolpyruvate--protein phosphotransferase [Victivallales bacterium]